MSHNGRRRRRFVQALAAMLLVTATVQNATPSVHTQQEQPGNMVASSGIEAAQQQQGETLSHLLDKKTAEQLVDRGSMLLKEQRPAEAVEAFEIAIGKYESALGPELQSAEAAQAVVRLGMAHRAAGEDDRAVDVLTRAVRVNENLFGKHSTQVAQCMHGLGLALLQQGRATASAAAFTTALRRRTGHGEKGNIEVVSQNLLGLVEASVQATSQAASVRDGGADSLKEALATVEEINRMSWRYFVAHSPSDGQAVLQKALDSVMAEDSDSPASVLAISAFLFNLGFLRLAVLGDYESAADVLKQARELRAPMLGIEHPLSVEAVVSRGWALALTGQTDTAVRELISCAEALLAADQAPAAERLLRQVFEVALNPLGVTTYAHACFTQHLNLLKSYGSEAHDEMSTFSQRQTAISREATLPRDHEGVSHAKKLLADALTAQIQERPPPSGTGGHSLLEYSITDIAQLQEEVDWLKKS